VWHRINLRNRIYLILTALVFISLLGGLITVWYTYRLERVLTEIIDRDLVAYQSAESFETSLINQKGFVSYYFLDGDPDWLRQLGKYRQIFNEQLHTARLRVEDREQKEAIGRAAAVLVEDGDTVFVNSGSTSYQVIRFLKGRKDVRIITNNAAAVADFGGKLGVELILTGGVYRHQSNCLIGDFAVSTISQIIASKIIMGVDGLCFEAGLTSPVYQEAGITRVMIDRTQGPVICVADTSKIGKVTNFVTASLSKVDILVTDWLFDEELRENLEALNIEIIKAEEI